MPGTEPLLKTPEEGKFIETEIVDVLLGAAENVKEK
jgi:hypothetical protein